MTTRHPSPVPHPAATRRPAKGLPPIVKLGLMVFAAIIVVAAIHDLRDYARRKAEAAAAPADLRELLPGFSVRRYEDPQGRFALTLPAAWRVLDGEDADPFTLSVEGPRDMGLDILVRPFPHDDFQRLAKEVRGIQAEWSINLNISETMFKGHPAVERTVKLVKIKLLVVDFLVGAEAHHLQVSAPRDSFDRLLPVLRELLDGYEPHPGTTEGGKPAPPAPAGS